MAALSARPTHNGGSLSALLTLPVRTVSGGAGTIVVPAFVGTLGIGRSLVMGAACSHDCKLSPAYGQSKYRQNAQNVAADSALANLKVRIPIEVGHRSDLRLVGIPISFRLPA